MRCRLAEELGGGELEGGRGEALLASQVAIEDGLAYGPARMTALGNGSARVGVLRREMLEMTRAYDA